MTPENIESNDFQNLDYENLDWSSPGKRDSGFYLGTSIENRLHGVGRLITDTGSIFEGQWKNS